MARPLSRGQPVSTFIAAVLMLEFAVSDIWLTVVAPDLFDIKGRAGNVTDPAQARCVGGTG